MISKPALVLTLAGALAFGACSKNANLPAAACPPCEAQKSANADQVVATYANHKVTMGELDEMIAKDQMIEYACYCGEDAYGLLECIAKISGTENRLQRMTPEGHEVMDEQIAEEVREIAKRGPFRFFQQRNSAS